MARGAVPLRIRCHRCHGVVDWVLLVHCPVRCHSRNFEGRIFVSDRHQSVHRFMDEITIFHCDFWTAGFVLEGDCFFLKLNACLLYLILVDGYHKFKYKLKIISIMRTHPPWCWG